MVIVVVLSSLITSIDMYISAEPNSIIITHSKHATHWSAILTLRPLRRFLPSPFE